MSPRLVVGVCVLMGLSEEGPSWVIGWKENRRSMVWRWGRGRGIEYDVVVDLGGRD